MAWRTGTATDYVDLLSKVQAHAIANHVATIVIASGGTGYTAGDTVTVAGGTALQAAKARVLTVDGGGAVLTAKLLLGGGSYSANPSTPNSPTGGTGTGLSLTLTFATNGWTVLRDVTVSTEKELILQGIGSGSDQIYVGIRTYRDTNTLAYNWELAGMTGFSSGNPWATQPGISPGRYDTVLDVRTEGGSYLPLDIGSMNYWVSATGRRIIVIVKVGSAYMTAYLGFYNSFSTTAEQPYPLVVAGSAPTKETRFSSNRQSLSFIADPIAKQSVAATQAWGPGPFQVRWVDGSWLSFRNRYEDFNNQTTLTSLNGSGRCVTPMNYVRLTAPLTGDGWQNNLWNWTFIVPQGSLTPTWELHPTPDGGSGQVPLWPIGMHMDTPSNQILGELDGVFWVSVAGSGLASEDTVSIASEDYLVIQNTFRTEGFQYVAIKEA